MIDKIIALDSEESAEVVERYQLGNFNDAPYNWHEITEEEFAKSMFGSYTPMYIDYKQIIDRDSPGRSMLPVKLFLMHDGTGFGMNFDYWGGKVRYFRFGCEHKYSELSAQECRERGISHFGKMYHVEECSKCGHIDAYDTSG